MPKIQHLPRTSRWLFRVDHFSSLPLTALVAVAILVAALVVGLALSVPSSWVTGFEVGTSFVTLTMVFVIQHTQGREQAATQRKLDELLRAMPEAENGLMMLEEAPDDVLRKVEIGQRHSRERAPHSDDLEW